MKKLTDLPVRSLMASLLLTIAMLCPITVMAEEGIWRKTIIIKTIDGATMEYLIDKDTEMMNLIMNGTLTQWPCRMIAFTGMTFLASLRRYHTPRLRIDN